MQRFTHLHHTHPMVWNTYHAPQKQLRSPAAQDLSEVLEACAQHWMKPWLIPPYVATSKFQAWKMSIWNCGSWTVVTHTHTLYWLHDFHRQVWNWSTSSAFEIVDLSNTRWFKTAIYEEIKELGLLQKFNARPTTVRCWGPLQYVVDLNDWMHGTKCSSLALQGGPGTILAYRGNLKIEPQHGDWFHLVRFCLQPNNLLV